MFSFRAGLAGLLMLACGVAPTAVAAELTALEQRWLRGVAPVVEQALADGVALDVVVQPQPAAGLPPLAMAFVGGRCKLVLSLRGNPQGQQTLDRIAAAVGEGDAALDAALGLMAAHEVQGHCRRHRLGQWHQRPVGGAEAVPEGLPEAQHEAFLQMRATRREEGYADLAALQWAAQRQPALYARLEAWLIAERLQGRIEGGHHDTLAWIRHPDAGRRAVASVWQEVLEAEMR